MQFFQYGKQNYWDKRYTLDPESFDWYIKLQEFEQQIAQYLHNEKQVLIVGGGTSSLSEDLFQRNIKNALSIDQCEIVTTLMKTKYPHLNYQTMKVQELSFESNFFDIIFDKACLDSIFCGENSFENAQKALAQIFRVLKPGGVLILLTNTEKNRRLTFLQKFEWEITPHQIKKPEMRMVDHVKDKDIPLVYTLFICKKK